MNLIIVHNNERSLNKCVEIAEKQGAITHLISENSFEKSLKKSFEFAVKNRWEWFILLGGDQYLKENALNILMENILNAKDNVFRISGNGYDYLHLNIRLMAPCVYRVKYLPAALKIDTTNKLRPETYIFKEITKNGNLKAKIIDEILSIHDYEQYYGHIYEKGYNQAKKSMRYFIKILPNIFKSNEMDHKVFLMGIMDFLIRIKRENILEFLNLKEKKAL